MGFVDPVLVCKKCSPASKTEEDFFQHHVKLLLTGQCCFFTIFIVIVYCYCLYLGAYFQLSDTEQIHNCTLSSDHQKIIITSHEPLFLTSIMEIKSNTSHSPDGNHLVLCVIVNKCDMFSSLGSRLNSLQLTHQREGVEQIITLSPSTEHSKKQSIDWLKGLRKVNMFVVVVVCCVIVVVITIGSNDFT